MNHAHHSDSPAPVLPMYDWALDASGIPLPIAHAGRGGDYRCPVCGERMVARRGSQKRHHFAHEMLTPDTALSCTPERVARAVAAYWLAQHLRTGLDRRRAVMLTWTCTLCREEHTADLLRNIAHVAQVPITLDTDWDTRDADLTLHDADGALAAVIILGRPRPAALERFAAQHVMVLGMDVQRQRHTLIDLPTMLAGATIYGGICTTQREAIRQGIVAEAGPLRDALIAAVSQPPHRLHGPLETLPGLTHVFTLGQRLLWLPPLLWQRAIGGMLHAISPALQIMTQEWPQPDGATIALYYVTARDSFAVAVRRFPPGQPVTARLGNASFRTPRLNAGYIARNLAEN